MQFGNAIFSICYKKRAMFLLNAERDLLYTCLHFSKIIRYENLFPGVILYLDVRSYIFDELKQLIDKMCEGNLI